MSDKEHTYNIEDYLMWRADVPLSVDPFNEVDNLVLSELAYTDFDGIIPEGGSMGIAEIRERFFQTHSREELRKLNTFTSKSPLLMDLMVSGSRFGNMTVSNFINVVDTEVDAQIAAMTYLLDDETAYVCFRGTDNTLVGWKEDFNLSYLTETEGQRLAVLYLTEAAESINGRSLRVGGHSKGGNFAIYAAAFAGEAIRDRIINVYSNDGPGFRREVTETEDYKSVVPKVISIVPETSIIGELLAHEYPDIVVKANESGFQQHNGFNWCVERNSFVRAELSDMGKFIRRTLSDWMAKMSDSTRQSFVNTLFDLFEATEFDTFHELSVQKRETLEKVMASLRVLPKEQQKEMMYVMRELLKSGSGVAADLIRAEIESRLNTEK